MEKNIQYTAPELSIFRVKAEHVILQASINSGYGYAQGKDMTVIDDEDW
ncbi:MAG: hypothetical protein IK031_06235 [Bacteroidales bacterium]|nr:hypothetical protein [Bacteroidales bacterium]